MQTLTWRQRLGDTVSVIVLGLTIGVLLFALFNWGASYVLGTYDGSQDHRTWGGGKGNPR